MSTPVFFLSAATPDLKPWRDTLHDPSYQQFDEFRAVIREKHRVIADPARKLPEIHKTRVRDPIDGKIQPTDVLIVALNATLQHHQYFVYPPTLPTFI